MGNTEFTVNITIERLREFIKAMRFAGQFDDFFDMGFSSSGFWIKQDIPDNPIRYKTQFAIKPQPNSVRLEIWNVYPRGQEPDRERPLLGWDRIRRDLMSGGYDVRDVTGYAIKGLFEHSFVDPNSIKNSSHRRVIERLIQAELDPERKTQKELSIELGYSEPRLSEIRNMYLRPEFQKPTGRKDE